MRLKTIETLDRRPFKHFCATIGELPTSFIDSMSYYDLLAWFCQYLENTVVPTVNENTEAVTELQELFVELKEYVDNYFANLDVQNEINNKLDEMAEGGQLADIISQYLNSTATFGYANVDSMKSASNLINGSYARTVGYYEVNDGGGGLYKIRNVTNEDIVDDSFIIAMQNTNLVAELIINNNCVDIRQLGGKPQIASNKFDNKNTIVKYINKLNNIENKLKLYIPTGIWYLSPLYISRGEGFNIFGDKAFQLYGNEGTVLTSLNENQDYIIKVGRSEDSITSSWVLENIIFSSNDYAWDSDQRYYKVDTQKQITDSALIIENAQYGLTDNLFFENIVGRALKINNSWENYYNLLNFRGVDARNSSVMLMQGEISASTFEKIMFEHVLGELIELSQSSVVINNNFNVINFEDNRIYRREDVTYTNFDSSNVQTFENSNPIHYALIKFNQGAYFYNVISSINLNNFSNKFSTFDNRNHSYDSLFKLDGDFVGYGLTLTAIDVVGCFKNPRLLITNNHTIDQTSAIKISSVNIKDNVKFVFDGGGIPYVEYNGRLEGASTSNNYRLPDSFTPAYKLVNTRTTMNHRPLVGDIECKNNLGVAVSLSSGIPQLTFITPNSSISACCKIPNGETAKIAFKAGSRDAVAIELLGTGSYKLYDLTPPIMNKGDTVEIMLSTSSQSQSCLIDYIV